jgi:hypothetical protein
LRLKQAERREALLIGPVALGRRERGHPHAQLLKEPQILGDRRAVGHAVAGRRCRQRQALLQLDDVR